jgi:hypothetical protein
MSEAQTMKVKLFWIHAPLKDPGLFVVAHTGGNARAGEAEINDWLAQNPGIDIRHIKQSAYGYGDAVFGRGDTAWLLSIWYTPGT